MKISVPSNSRAMPNMIICIETVFWMSEHVIRGDMEIIVWIVRGQTRLTVVRKPGLLEEAEHGHVLGDGFTKIESVSPVTLYIQRNYCDLLS